MSPELPRRHERVREDKEDGMNAHITARGLVLTLVLTAASSCSPPEKAVVDKYFHAVQAKDHQTLTSFAAVVLDKPVEAWKITKAGEEKQSAAALPELMGKVKDLEAQLAANKKAAAAYNLENYAKIEKVDALKKGAPVPAALAGVVAEWDKFKHKDRELKKALATAKDAVDKEKRYMVLSVGAVSDLESLTGKMADKQVELDLTLKDEKPKPYVMLLRKYDLVRAAGSKVMSRWIVYELAPRG
jgi:hypothetical protein